MRNALIRLAPCAVFLSVLASAQTITNPQTTGTGATPATPVTGTDVNSPSAAPGGLTTSAPSLQGTLGGVAPAPVLNPAAANQTGANPIAPVPGAALAVPAAGAVVPLAKRSSHIQHGAPVKAPATSPVKTPGAKGTPGASAVLDTAARGIELGKKSEAEGGDGLSVRRALDRAYDASMRPGDVSASGGVAGKFSSARDKVAGLVGVANNSAPADAPALYGSAIETASQALPAAAASAMTKAVLSFAARKAERSLSALVQDAYAAATAGQASEARRLVKSLDKWEELLGVPGRPLIANGERLKADVERALAGSEPSGAKGSAPRVWVVKRGSSYVAALPGTTVEKIPGLAAGFALKFEKLPLSPLAGAYRAFAANPGARSTIGARAALGESVPYAALSTGWLWLKYMLLRAWSVFASFLPGRGLPSAVNAGTLPRLREAAKAWRDAAGLGGAAALAAGAPRLTVSRARGAFELARRAAGAHEALSGEAGAVYRVASLSSEFEAGVKRAALSPADRLTAGLEALVAGDGGLRHWASLYASDARARGAAAFGKLRGPGPVLVLGDGPGARAAADIAAASKAMTVAAYGDALWASGSGSYGAANVSADLRSTENGGSVVLETQRGDEKLAAALDELGFLVTRDGSGLRATLDAETASADAAEMREFAADAAALIMGSSLKPLPASAGLDRLLADMKNSPLKASRSAASLDGTSRLSRAKVVGWVGDYEAVSAENRSAGVRVIALRDPATGLAKFSRIEPLRAR